MATTSNTTREDSQQQIPRSPHSPRSPRTDRTARSPHTPRTPKKGRSNEDLISLETCTFYNHHMEELDSTYLKGKVIAFYFSAMWCPQCRMFTGKLNKMYKEVRKTEDDFEIVLVSRDKCKADAIEYFLDRNGDWLMLKFDDERIQAMLKKYNIRSIPCLVILRDDGRLILDNVIADVKDAYQTRPRELFVEWREKVYGTVAWPTREPPHRPN